MTDEIKPVSPASEEKTPVAEGNAANKAEADKSEFWMSLLGAGATLVGSLMSLKGLSSGAVTAIGICGLVAIVGSYAYFKTGFHATISGFKTPAFWAALTSILGSVAVAISEATIPGLSPGVSRVAALVASAVIASGYTIYRWDAKMTTLKLSKKK